ncbi:MAG TPA: lipopolysaccharide kinase InaA family protein [Candidatus Binataceae bacterium]|nr:lipopolysaccharide kinase InaA family protein [Candidatus Binataceae bacterium]
MKEVTTARIERDGWSLLLARALAEVPTRLGLELIERALKIAAGSGGEPIRRSRHASTYPIRLGTPLDGATEVFVKLLDAPRGLKAVRRLVLPSRAERMQATLDALVAAGFAVAPILMLGDEHGSGRTMMVTARVAGDSLPNFLLRTAGAPGRRREVLRALGAEVAQLHRAGFIHGDLTPYNIFVASGAPARFSLIDHERTAMPRVIWERRRLRNLVQLCRFELAGMSRTDRIRIVDAYGHAMGGTSHRLIRRVAAMLRARRLRDTVSDGMEPAYGGSWQRPA